MGAAAVLALALLAQAIDPGIARGVAAAGTSASDQPALRREAEPGEGYRLGAALGAWINAAATLDYDLRTPSGDGDDSETIHLDCVDERAAFDHMEAGRQALGLSPGAAARAGGQGGVAADWLKRQASVPTGC